LSTNVTNTPHTLSCFHIAEVLVTSPFFNRTSFVSYPVVNNSPFASNINMEFKSQSLRDGIILYGGDKGDGSGDSMAIVQKDGYLEFRFDTGSGKGLLVYNNLFRIYCEASYPSLH